MAITLTFPVEAAEIQALYPRETAGMGATEIDGLLEAEEYALRSEFGVTNTDADTDLALAQAMKLAWHSFRMQVRQVSQESVGATQAAVTYARAGVIDFQWPSFVSAVLAPVATESSVPSPPAVTVLERS